MTVSIMLITHEEVGNALLSAVTTTLGELPLPTTVVTINYDTDPALLMPRLDLLTQNMDHGAGLLILTDLYGSTPCNIAKQLQTNNRIRIVTGLNLPMLIRVMNYPKLSIAELAEKAYSGGRDGIKTYEEEC